MAANMAEDIARCSKSWALCGREDGREHRKVFVAVRAVAGRNDRDRREASRVVYVG